MTGNPQDPRTTVLALMNVTRREWGLKLELKRQGNRQLDWCGQHAGGAEGVAYAWPTGGILAVRRDEDKLVGRQREQA